MPNKSRPDKHLAPRRGMGSKPRSRGPARSVGQALDALLQRQPQLAARVLQDTDKNELIDAVRALLPPDLASHALAARQQRTQLLVTADSAAWSGRLRYALAAALPGLQKRWPDISAVRLRVGSL
jgi:hypothetical protein